MVKPGITRRDQGPSRLKGKVQPQNLRSDPWSMKGTTRWDALKIERMIPRAGADMGSSETNSTERFKRSAEIDLTIGGHGGPI